MLSDHRIRTIAMKRCCGCNGGCREQNCCIVQIFMIPANTSRHWLCNQVCGIESHTTARSSNRYPHVHRNHWNRYLSRLATIRAFDFSGVWRALCPAMSAWQSDTTAGLASCKTSGDNKRYHGGVTKGAVAD